MFAVIRIRGTADMNRKVEDTLKMLRLEHVNNCVIVPDDGSYKGMVEKVKDYVTYGEINKEILVSLLKKRLRLKANRRIGEKELKSLLKIDSFEELAEKMMKGEVRLKDFDQLQTNFRLTPPSKGFDSVREYFPKGDLGFRGEKINELLERMI